MNDFQHYIHASRYARWLPEKGRRETWEETVKRYCDFWVNKYPEQFPYEEVYTSIINMEVMPSMRALMTAGPALERDNIAGFNCSYIPIVDQRCFDELMYILMCGTGVGYSVERQYVGRLPEVAESFYESDTVVTVADSKAGWASALREVISLLYAGKIPKWDVSKVRPAGARLKIFGGRASGPTPLVELFSFTCQLFKRAQGRKLTSIECSDLVCKIAEVVVVGGVRRSALICLSNLSDDRMRTYKSGQWWLDEGQRALANISAAYTEKPDIGTFMEEWKALYMSKSGERGIFNRVAATKAAEATGRRDCSYEFGTNPCGEIVLRPFGFCNLSEVIIRSSDKDVDLERKVRVASIIGTFQSTLTNYRYIRKQWTTNAEEERLLGVSMTGIMDHPVLASPNVQAGELLLKLKQIAINTNKEYACKLNISSSAAITTVKPSGTVSQLVDSASGIHPRYSEYYIRTVRTDKKDPLAVFLQEQGVKNSPDVTNENTLVFDFPVKSPNNAVMRKDLTAIKQLEHYLLFKNYWCEHNPSITVYVREQEWLDVAAWVYKNFNSLGGVSFLPYSDHVYAQAPYQEITAEQYEKAAAEFPVINWSEFDKYEVDDASMNMREFACTNGACELI